MDFVFAVYTERIKNKYIFFILDFFVRDKYVLWRIKFSGILRRVIV